MIKYKQDNDWFKKMEGRYEHEKNTFCHSFGFLCFYSIIMWLSWKSWKALRRENIPKEVTRDLQLERGVYAPFVWTSDSDAIIISGTDAIVNQKDEDVMVNLTATVNKRSEIFEIKVLKIGSPLSSREKSEDIVVYLNETYNEIDGGLLELPNEMNGIYIKYQLNLAQSSYGYKIDNQKPCLSSSYRASGEVISIPMSFYDDIEMGLQVAKYMVLI